MHNPSPFFTMEPTYERWGLQRFGAAEGDDHWAVHVMNLKLVKAEMLDHLGQFSRR